MDTPFLSVIIPAYNEQKRIVGTLKDIHNFLSRANFSYEIIVVNDGSRDATTSVVKGLTEEIKNLKLIDNNQNRGKGAVVRQGMQTAGGQYRLFMDADNSTRINEFFNFLPQFELGYDVIIGSRQIKGAKMDPPQSFYKRWLGRWGNWWIQWWILPGIKDTQAGFKCFTAGAATKIFSLAHLDGWGFDIEILALARKLGYRIKEMPILWSNDADSRVGPLDYFKVLLETIKIRRWIRRLPIN